ncbi:MAG TPA: hypothetical protein PLL09_02405 [Flavobacterium sp.]|uniref:hypothetical protein n=1 Tax=unclassified Flavobacterium TaxID=196869 RepID=UPI0025C02F27|nr:MULTISPECIES: hypothetical protein [unclassified Flavobacterium]HRE76656.1 hypothetical protein [Flavobacterium sp.]
MKKIYNILVLVSSFLFITSCEVEPADIKLDPNFYVPINDEIKEGLLRVAKYGTTNNDNSVCIEFVYPFTILSFDSSYELITSQVIQESNQLVSFLEGVPETINISLSYPISAILPDGELFSISNNDELIIALNACTLEDIIAENNVQLVTEGICFWKVPYTESEFDNTFSGGYFTANEDGLITFNYKNITYTGTWVHLFIDSELYLNINLLGNSAASQYWNKNFKISGNFNSKILISEFSVPLIRNYGSTINYSVGQNGPNEGIISYAKDSYDQGWKYIEVSSQDQVQEEWGCTAYSLTLAEHNEIGEGLFNTIAIANYHDQINYYLNPSVCSSENNGSVTAKTALVSDTIYKNWFIPSIDELELIYTNIHLNGAGNFTNDIYWSSTQASENSAFGINFNDGTVVEIPKNSSIAKTRKIIYF